MTSTTVRTKVESVGEERVGEGKDPDMQPIVEEVVPYTDYENKEGHPYTVDHFELGKYWDEGMGGFESEVEIIEHYISKQIKSGEWANNQKTIKTELKKIEKLTNMKDETRPVVKIGIIAAHIKFLMETDGIKADFAKYGSTN